MAELESEVCSTRARLRGGDCSGSESVSVSCSVSSSESESGRGLIGMLLCIADVKQNGKTSSDDPVTY